MKKVILGATLLLVAVPLLASAHGHSRYSNGHNQHQHANNPPVSNPKPVPGSVPSAPIPVSKPGTPPPSSAGSEVRFVAYTTGYGWPDNTPAGNAISNPIIHAGAGGTGTYADPITLAVGHSIINGNDILDYPAGTKFYVPNLHRYFIAEDTCGDGNSPQNAPCHSGFSGHVWLDLWVGGTAASQSATPVCEDAITDLHTVIENPASNYAVVAGAETESGCKQYGDTIVSL